MPPLADAGLALIPPVAVVILAGNAPPALGVAAGIAPGSICCEVSAMRFVVRSNGSTTPRASGFIAPEDGSEDVFVHYSAINSPALPRLLEGQRVSLRW